MRGREHCEAGPGCYCTQGFLQLMPCFAVTRVSEWALQDASPVACAFGNPAVADSPWNLLADARETASRNAKKKVVQVPAAVVVLLISACRWAAQKMNGIPRGHESCD